jgi:hypothetical protein
MEFSMEGYGVIDGWKDDVVIDGKKFEGNLRSINPDDYKFTGLKFKDNFEGHVVELETQHYITKYSFIPSGMGFSSDYCMSEMVSAISKTADALQVSRLKCSRWQCPNCYWKNIGDYVFEYATKIHLYSKHTGETPIGLTASIHPRYYRDNKLNWSDYINSFRRMYRQLKKLGIDAYLRTFHPFRIPSKIKMQLKKAGYAQEGEGGLGGYWKGVRNDALHLGGELHYAKYVELSPHLHIIGFPEMIENNTSKEIVVKKYATFNKLEDLTDHLQYLFTHTASSNDFQMEANSFCGKLYKWNPEEHFTKEEIVEAKQAVAEAMRIEYDAENDCPLYNSDDKEKEEKYEWIPMRDVVAFTIEAKERVMGMFDYGWNGEDAISDKEFMLSEEKYMFVQGIVESYNSKIRRTDLPKSERVLFFEEVEPYLPDFVEVVYIDDWAEKSAKDKIKTGGVG